MLAKLFRAAFGTTWKIVEEDLTEVQQATDQAAPDSVTEGG